MKPDPDPRWLQTCFSKLREEDHRRTPAFERVWHAAGLQGRELGRRWIMQRVAAAGVLAAVGLAGAWVIGRQMRPRALVQTPTNYFAPHIGPLVASREPQAALAATEMALSNWQSPTDFLLDTSDLAPSLARPSPGQTGGDSAPPRGAEKKNF